MPITFDSDYFMGKPIRFFRVAEGIVDPAAFAYNIRYLKEERNGPPYWLEKWLAFSNDPRVSEVTELVVGGDNDQVGGGESCAEQIECLVSGREKLPALTALFFEGHNSQYDEDDWLFALPDVSPLLQAFPQLEVLALYGWTNCSDFQIGTMHSEVLRELTIATGWLHPRILHDLWRAHLPALEHLELWLHAETENLNPLITVDDLAPLFSGTLFPRLRSLTLRLSPIEDDLAVALATSPLLERLKVLQLFKGILTDRGAQALVASPALHHLEKLVIGYHFCSDSMVQQLRALPLAVEIDEPINLHNTYYGVPEIYTQQFHVTFT